MIKTFVKNSILAFAVALTLSPLGVQAYVVFDTFNVDEGHFNLAPTFSGSTVGILGSSTADRIITDGPVEGVGHERLVFNTNSAASVRCRFLSGSGTIGNNTAFTTSAAEDGWIGCYVKSTNAGWTVQIWLEGASNNGGTPQEVIADGEWHLYEWDLDNIIGSTDTNGWGNISGIISGSSSVADGSHTIDSVIFRNAGPTNAVNVFYMDFVAKSDSGSVSNLLLIPCLATSGVLVNGPLGTNSNQVLVTGASAASTAITVYQDTGSGMTAIGTKTTGITAGNNFVTVSGLVKGATVAATQTANGQESCLPSTGIIVGGGANPPVRIALTVREMTNTVATIGAPGAIAGQNNLHFLGASTVTGSAPVDAPIVYPSNDWQTVTFDRGTIAIGSSANTAGALAEGPGYLANDTVAIRVYAYSFTNNTLIFSRVPAQSALMTSNDTFSVNWTWDAVPNADGYRLLRDYNGDSYTNVSADVVGANNFNDANNAWGGIAPVTPSNTQTNLSIQWFPAVGNANALPGRWGTLESINFVIADETDTGPYDLYIDNVQNGTTVFQTFEGAAAKTTGYGFRPPSFSGTTSGGILSAPDIGQVSNGAADSGTKSFRVSWQWNGTNVSKWLRLTTSDALPAGNPYVDLDQPISFRLLLLPVGATPVAPLAPTISASRVGSQVVLDWVGTHRLQAASQVTGTYTNVTGITNSPWNNTYTEPQKFFRLLD